MLCIVLCGSVTTVFFFGLYICHLYRKVFPIYRYIIVYVLNHLPSASRLRRGGLLALGAGECGLGFDGKVKGLKMGVSRA